MSGQNLPLKFFLDHPTSGVASLFATTSSTAMMTERRETASPIYVVATGLNYGKTKLLKFTSDPRCTLSVSLGTWAGRRLRRAARSAVRHFSSFIGSSSGEWVTERVDYRSLCGAFPGARVRPSPPSTAFASLPRTL